ncbi:hypothetical protein, variant 2 [Cryptococcus amylolentus CBS 6039]|uniref:Uncharacterized protein n=1 Tax=Cryptococcus amylolentus CBS 6039 TaxID=1295533 RepID=A0A1E3HGJ2_9TREE|nr:hypothetical protein L202_06606 [Cryptococcus amylolentus CBS 6039]XP_018991120.1 hypothetical protein, variant 1 [Cryptococcus amylolentus CBS 6039]XP_018991121.1 hypothetical protein, variant 2 [Cryptococcus amylolentus CBS 6039]ODN75469.1 hypothetical protein L202_06606 [Cryptococcus amylolentus CBS 6039]ODN75470.1 hypothetical protein, variant 1 [Cryptococcus amylolentus CBS 6039]ODN75471.1 hypothetical protein, variant 2 [Cryptococcus amylolentus CBS 6039]
MVSANAFMLNAPPCPFGESSNCRPLATLRAYLGSGSRVPSLVSSSYAISVSCLLGNVSPSCRKSAQCNGSRCLLSSFVHTLRWLSCLCLYAHTVSLSSFCPTLDTSAGACRQP